jgi:hypothetical protein
VSLFDSHRDHSSDDWFAPRAKQGYSQEQVQSEASAVELSSYGKYLHKRVQESHIEAAGSGHKHRLYRLDAITSAIIVYLYYLVMEKLPMISVRTIYHNLAIFQHQNRTRDCGRNLAI